MEIGDTVRLVGILEDLFVNVVWEIIHIKRSMGRTFYTITTEMFGTRTVQSDEIELVNLIDTDLGI